MGKIGTRDAVKVASYLGAIALNGFDSKKTLLVWKGKLRWRQQVFQRQGGAHTKSKTKRSGGSGAYYILKSVLKKVHKNKMAGAL